jgi:hypothetical protein
MPLYPKNGTVTFRPLRGNNSWAFRPVHLLAFNGTMSDAAAERGWIKDLRPMTLRDAKQLGEAYAHHRCGACASNLNPLYVQT